MRTRADRARTLFGLAGTLLGLAGLLAGGPGRAQEGTGSGQTVTLVVRGPDGKPLRNHALTEYRVKVYGPRGPALTEPTDAQGRVTVTVPAAPPSAPDEMLRLGVSAPGVGFGTTGVIEVGPGGSVTALLPPLAPFAQVSGIVAPALRLAGETIHLDSSSALGQTRLPVLVDLQGRFTLDDVPPGRVQIVAEDDAGARLGWGRQFYFVYQIAPGEQRTGVVLSPSTAERTVPPFVPTTSPAPTRTVTLRGTITDDQGKPVAGADVYAVVPYPFSSRLRGDDRFYQVGSISGNSHFGKPTQLSATTGADGKYVLSSATIADSASELAVLLAATAPGHPSAVAAALVAPGAAGDVRADLVLSTQHTALTVRVTGPDGRPVVGALVRVSPEARLPRFADFGGSIVTVPAAALPETLFAPSGHTGPDGTARFADLTPGLWDVQASSSGSGTAPNEFSLVFRSGGFTGVAVGVGRGASCTVALARRPDGPTVRVLGPDGQAVPVQYATLQPGSATLPGQATSLVGPDAPGMSRAWDVTISVDALQAGLWHVGADYRDRPEPGGSYGVTVPEPYNEANALLALSPALPPPGLVVLHALRHGPGSLRVRLLDARGRPARGTVLVTGPNSGSASDCAASVDAGGEAVFSGMSSGDYTLIGSFADQPQSPDAAPAARPLLLPQYVTVTGDHETAAVLRPQPVGYVRVRLRPVPPDTTKDFVVYPVVVGGRAVGQVRRDEDGGAFLEGPLPPGKVTIPVFRAAATIWPREAGAVMVNVVAGKVTDAVFTPATPPDGATPPASSFSGTVLLADGVTPAWGAEAVPFLPPALDLSHLERADALGRLQPGTVQWLSPARPSSALETPPTGPDPTTPVLVAWLPGTAGAAIVPYTPGQTARVVLPLALTVTGRVTVGGRSAAGQPGTLRVRAEYQGRGRLDDLLSVDVTAAPDGTFTLDGLTPGTYLVQAARDGLWLSASRTLTVGPAPAPPLLLDIAPPGAPVVLHLSPGQVVALDRPAGPLTGLLWPATVRADGIGDLRLDGLEAGRHTVRPTGGGPPIAFAVPAVPVGG